jgi:hypothetical protein
MVILTAGREEALFGAGCLIILCTCKECVLRLDLLENCDLHMAQVYRLPPV